MKQRTILAIVFLFGLGLFLMLWPEKQELPSLLQIEPFTLSSVNGEEYQLQQQETIKVVTFFYTKCPDICPMTMTDMKKVQEMLQEENYFGREVELVSISLDPENDTATVIRNYATAFQADFRGWKWLRGTKEQTKEIANMFQMNHQKLEGDFIAHRTTIYLLDKDNQIRALYEMANQDQPVDIDQIMEDIRLLISN